MTVLRRAVVALALLVLASAAGRSPTTPAAQGTPSTTTAPMVMLPPTTAATTTSSTTTTTRPPRYPLTGRLATDPATLERAAVSVKIDNVAAARPQTSIERADVIYEEFTEGVTRLIAVWHSTDAEAVGPVRSVRPADPTIVLPLGGVFAFSGGSPAAVALAVETPLAIVTEGATDVMYRRSGRFAPHNLYASLEGLRNKAHTADKPPPLAEFLPPGAPFAAAGATEVRHVSLAPAPYLTAAYDWEFETNTWKRSTDGSPHLAEDGQQLAPTNVVVQFTPYSYFAADAAVQYPEVVGSGEAWILAGGKLAKGSWSKPSPTDVTTFTDANGAPILLLPGQTWVHLVAPGSFVEAS